MEMHEYLDTISEQIRCKKARPMVVEEIENHINDQAEAYIKDGMERMRHGTRRLRKWEIP